MFLKLCVICIYLSIHKINNLQSSLKHRGQSYATNNGLKTKLLTCYVTLQKTKHEPLKNVFLYRKRSFMVQIYMHTQSNDQTQHSKTSIIAPKDMPWFQSSKGVGDFRTWTATASCFWFRTGEPLTPAKRGLELCNNYEEKRQKCQKKLRKNLIVKQLTLFCLNVVHDCLR